LEFPGFSQGWVQEWQNTGQPGRSSADFGENKDIIQSSKLAVLCAISKDAILWENLAVLVWGMYSLHAPLKHRLSTPVDLCMSHQSLTVRNKLIDFIRRPWYD